MLIWSLAFASLIYVRSINTCSDGFLLFVSTEFWWPIILVDHRLPLTYVMVMSVAVERICRIIIHIYNSFQCEVVGHDDRRPFKDWPFTCFSFWFSSRQNQLYRKIHKITTWFFTTFVLADVAKDFMVIFSYCSSLLILGLLG